MCNGSTISAGPPIALPLNRSLTQSFDRVQPPPGQAKNADSANPANAASAAGSSDPDRGKNLNISA